MPEPSNQRIYAVEKYMRRCAVLSWLKPTQSQASRAMSHALVAALFVAGLAMSMMLMAGSAEACPKGKEASGSVSVVQHKVIHSIATKWVTSAPMLAKNLSQTGGQCCGGGCHSHCKGCASGCCSAFSTAIDAAASSLVLLDGSIIHILAQQSEIISTRPPPDFRPPRIIA